MLDFIRRKSASTVVMFIFGIIILVFVFWGFNPGKRGAGNRVVAKVNGMDISTELYENLYKRELNKIKEQQGGVITEDMLESLQLDQRVLNMLINDVLIIDEAKSTGIKASNEEVQAKIFADPNLREEGRPFNKKFYLELLKRNRINPLEYEEGIREKLTAQKMLNSIAADVRFTDDELWEKYAEANSSFSYDYAEFNPKKFMDTGAVTEETLKKYYEENKTAFPVATAIKAFYARAGFKALGTQIKINDDDIKRYYEANTYDYLREAEVHASHILIKGEGALKKAEEILARIKAGESFSALARAHSEDRGSASKGGDLGFFGPGTMHKEFEKAAFTLGAGEVSEPVRTPFGYHIIKVVEITEEGVKALAEVSSDIRAILLKAQAVFAAMDSIESLQEAFAEKDDIKELEALVEELSLESATTGLILEDAQGGVLLKDEGLRNAAFGLNAGGVSAPVETEDGVYLIKILERVESHAATFEEARARIEESYRKDKSIEGAKSGADDLLKRVIGGESFDGALTGKGLKKRVTGYIVRERAVIEKIGLYLGDMDGLFKLTADAPYYPEVVSHNNAFYVFKLSGTRAAGRAPFDANIEAIRGRYQYIKRIQAQNAWIDGLREKAEISVNQDYF